MVRSWDQELRLALLTTIITPGLKFACNSWRAQKICPPAAEQIIVAGKPVIYALWHGRMYAILKGISGENTGILVSNSRDGEMIARIAAGMGFNKLIRGSHKKGGAQAMRKMLKALTEENMSLAFTVDGPLGPREQVKIGVIKLASQAGVPIIPLVPSCRRLLHRFTKSWDHFHAPQFYTEMQLLYGEPFYVPAMSEQDDASHYANVVETHRVLLQEAMHRLTLEADRIYSTKSALGVCTPPHSYLRALPSQEGKGA